MLDHYDIGLVKVQLPSLSERTFQERDFYLVTGKEQRRRQAAAEIG